MEKGNLNYTLLRYVYDTAGKMISGFIFLGAVYLMLSGTDSGASSSIIPVFKTGNILSVNSGLLLMPACYIAGCSLQIMGKSKRLEYKALQALNNDYGRPETRIEGRVPPFSCFFLKTNVRLPVLQSGLSVIRKLDKERELMLSRLGVIESVSEDVSINLFRLKTQISMASALYSGILIIFLFMVILIFINGKFFPVSGYAEIFIPFIVLLSIRLLIKYFWHSYYRDVAGTYLLFQLQSVYDENSH